ncbi:Cof-type HAD-IIB family hydrolase [Maribacter flavus]|uniref:HAD family phosphatase n=1 Tax=Maribacter flavus TaxID=1658664 RepID=A0A5B2TPP3_9FLAO|nr:Cof-type HAD-IIB family hydrolase [Maribacter flavus]KAA2216406.1 HAD family phosphatase [Maribacter flavus]
MKFKLLCSDLDGTLLSTKSDVSKYTISQFSRIKEIARIMLVSARMPNGMYYIQKDLGILEQPIVCFNGALVLDGAEELLSVTIPMDMVGKIHEVCEANRTELGLYAFDEWHVPRMSERVEKEIKYTKTSPVFQPTQATLEQWTTQKSGVHKIMLMGTKPTSDALMPILQEDFGKEINVYRSNDTLIEISPKSVSKLTAIQKLLRTGELLEDVIAFGDNYNDLEMLSNVGWGVAVSNGREEVKQIAKFVTASNTDDGVAKYIEQHLLI